MNEYGVRDSWTKQYVIDNIIEASYYKAYRLTKNREILVLCADVFLISYDLKGRSSRYITFQGSSKKSHDFMFPFVPNFLRVQTKDRLEGKNTTGITLAVYHNLELATRCMRQEACDTVPHDTRSCYIGPCDKDSVAWHNPLKRRLERDEST
ncbi:hypothetical protein LguiA_022189 [Lonicera macranthoides]